MTKSTLLRLLETFTKEDWKLYTNYAKVHYKDDSLQSVIMEILRKSKNHRELNTNKQLQSYLIEEGTIEQNTRTVANALTGLTSTIKSYLIYQQIEKDQGYGQAILATALAERGAKEVFNKHTEVETSDESGIDIWHNYHKLKQNFHAYYGGFHQDYEVSKKKLEELVGNISTFQAEMSEFVGLEIMNRKLILGESYDETEALLTIQNDTSTELIQLCQQIRILREKNDHSALDYLMNFVKKQTGESKVVLEIVMVHMISYLNREIKKGGHNYAAQLLELYTLGIQNGFYLTNGQMSLRRYLNIVHTACALQYQDWAQDFAKNYTKLLDKKVQKEGLLVAMASVDFSNKDFVKVSTMINKQRFKDFDLELRARLLKLQCNFEIEKENTTHIVDEIRSMKYYIKRNEDKISKATSEGTYTLLRYLQALLTKNENDLLGKLNTEKYIMSKTWLVAKIKEL